VPDRYRDVVSEYFSAADRDIKSPVSPQ